MKYISSDTNIWLDFYVINKLEFPFRLDYVYLMHYETVDQEVISPPELCERLMDYGLEKTDMTFDEYFDVPVLARKYPKLSKYDRIALSIAKHRSITLLTGDKPLRNAAEKEGVAVIGSIGILDELYRNGFISNDEYLCCLNDFLKHDERRLPTEEIRKRIKEIEEKGRD